MFWSWCILGIFYFSIKLTMSICNKHRNRPNGTMDPKTVSTQDLGHICFILVRQFSLAPFPVSSISSRIAHSLTCWVSAWPNNWLFSEYCLLPLDLCTGWSSWLSGFHPDTLLSTRRTTDQPNQKLQALITLLSISIWHTPPQSSHTPSLLASSVPPQSLHQCPKSG